MIINEHLYLHPNFFDILEHMATSNNKVARVLYSFRAQYKTNSEINFVNITDDPSKIAYHPSKKINKNIYNFDEFLDANVTAKTGRVIRKILDTLNVGKKIKVSGNASLYDDKHYLVLYDSNLKNLDYIKDRYYQVYLDDYRTEFILTLKKDDKIIKCYSYKESRYPIYLNEKISLTIEENIENIKSKFHHIYNINSIFDDHYHDGTEIKSIIDNKDLVEYELEFWNNVVITDKDIEDFVNLYKSTLELLSSNDGNVGFEIVKGDDIGKWYDRSNIKINIGQLGNSCMNGTPVDYFNIYMKNDNVSMLILKDENNKLRGRAILWKLSYNSYNDCEYYLDRQYTIVDSDRNLFENYAIQNNYLYRKNSNIDIFFAGENIGNLIGINLNVKLKNYHFNNYPYIDSLSYLDLDTGILSSVPIKESSELVVLNSTEGEVEYVGN